MTKPAPGNRTVEKLKARLSDIGARMDVLLDAYKTALFNGDKRRSAEIREEMDRMAREAEELELQIPVACECEAATLGATNRELVGNMKAMRIELMSNYAAALGNFRRNPTDAHARVLVTAERLACGVNGDLFELTEQPEYDASKWRSADWHLTDDVAKRLLYVAKHDVPKPRPADRPWHDLMTKIAANEAAIAALRENARA